jgi:dihydrofolate reductase
MGKLISLINITADGFVDSQYVIADAEFHEFVHGLLANTHTVAFGRSTFELFQGIWPPVLEKDNQPESQVKMAKALNDMPKTVYSSTLKTTTWNKSTIVKSIDPDQLIQMKRDSEKDLLTIGSPGMIAALTKQHLVDEYYFSIQPLIAGSGKVRLFDQLNLDNRQPLKFVSSKQLKSGVMIINYQKS